MFNIWNVMGKCTVVAKKELIYVSGPFGFCAYLCGLIFIDRYRVDRAKNRMNEAMEELKKKNIKLWIFPEGTRRNTGTIHEFKKGAFSVAISSQVPIVPVVISSYSVFLDKKEKIFNSSEVVIEALPAVSTQGLTHGDIDQLMQKCRQMMLEKYIENTKEIQLRQPHLPKIKLGN
jgi:lysophosphatidate acyltransferase